MRFHRHRDRSDHSPARYFQHAHDVAAQAFGREVMEGRPSRILARQTPRITRWPNARVTAKLLSLTHFDYVGLSPTSNEHAA